MIELIKNKKAQAGALITSAMFAAPAAFADTADTTAELTTQLEGAMSSTLEVVTLVGLGLISIGVSIFIFRKVQSFLSNR